MINEFRLNLILINLFSKWYLISETMPDFFGEWSSTSDYFDIAYGDNNDNNDDNNDWDVTLLNSL